MKPRYVFDDFQFDSDLMRLTKKGGERSLEPKALDALLLLLEAAPVLVTDHKFNARLWPNESAGLKPDQKDPRLAKRLNLLINIIRNTLGDTRKTRRLIRNRPGKGYEFIGTVARQDNTTAAHLGDDPASASSTDIPRVLSLTTKKNNPQWADFGDYIINAPLGWSLQCTLSTESPYFRFGFKLLGNTGRVFGDGSIQSQDSNLVVHVGRNYWNRPGMSRHDLFLTAYLNGTRLGDDKKFIRTAKRLVIPMALTVDRSYEAHLLLNGDSRFRQVVPPGICRRIAILAWGDQEDFDVTLTDISLKAL